jgi:hypothetical protein
VGSPAVLARCLPDRRGRPRIGILPAQNQGVKPNMVSGTLLWKVRLIEEDFRRLIFETEGA